MKIGTAIKADVSEMLYLQDTTLINNDWGVGVEVELENIQYAHATNDKPEIIDLERFHADRGIRDKLPGFKGLWKIVHDGSLRTGEEFVFNGPLVGANITKALKVFQDFVDVYSFNNKSIQVSKRCSVHVHLDVRDMNEEELVNFILIYILVERLLFIYINPERKKNNYCKPLTDSAFKHIIAELKDRPGDIDMLLWTIRHSCDKYSALNILPVIKYGSAEFRHHHGTIDILSLKNWINIIFAVKRASQYHITYYLDGYNKFGFDWVINNIFEGTVLKDILLNDYEAPHLLLRGYNDTSEIVNMGRLKELTTSHERAKVRPVNTLLYKFKVANGLLPKKEPSKPVKIKQPEKLDIFHEWQPVVNTLTDLTGE